jgi:hypothetical protein
MVTMDLPRSRALAALLENVTITENNHVRTVKSVPTMVRATEAHSKTSIPESRRIFSTRARSQ